MYSFKTYNFNLIRKQIMDNPILNIFLALIIAPSLLLFDYLTDYDIITGILTVFIAPLLIIIVNYYIERIKKNKKSKKDKLDDLLTNSDLIHTELNSILDEFNADRVWIAQFHNGAYYYPSNKSIKKFSIFYEESAHSVSKISSFIQGIPCSLYSRALANILTDDGLYIEDYKENDNYGLGSIGDTGGAKSSTYFPLYSFDQKPIGFLCVDWVKKKAKVDTDDTELLKNKSYRIAGYLTNYLDNL